MDLEDYNFLIQGLVNQFIKKKKLSFKDKDQFLNEARLAAWKAIGDFKQEKMVKITTYISTCVNNHLINVSKEKSRNDRRLKEAIQVSTETPVYQKNSIEDLEFVLSMKSILTAQEFSVFEMRFIQDCPVSEIRKLLGLTQREVEKCIYHICHLYLSIEENLNKNLTQIQLQNSWLENSQE